MVVLGEAAVSYERGTPVIDHQPGVGLVTSEVVQGDLGRALV